MFVHAALWQANHTKGSEIMVSGGLKQLVEAHNSARAVLAPPKPHATETLT